MDVSEWWTNIIHDLYKYNFNNNENKEIVISFFNALIDLNFLRDAYRVDVAIQTNSIYITADKLSFIYYTLITHWEQKKHLGLFIRAPIGNSQEPSINVIIGETQPIYNNSNNANTQNNNDGLKNLTHFFVKNKNK